jgi:hypothetical protein
VRRPSCRCSHAFVSRHSVLLGPVCTSTAQQLDVRTTPGVAHCAASWWCAALTRGEGKVTTQFLC